MCPANNRTSGVTFGFQKEWQDFERRNKLFLERFPNIERAIALAFTRTASLSEPIDKFVLMFGRVCCEDFSEILLCCGNGSGQAAQKLLRGLYERTVTLRYLHEHPVEIDDFLDFYHVAQRKLLIASESTMGTGTFSSEQASEIEKRYEEVKERFMVTDCKQCGTKRLNHTWSKLNFVAMANKTSLGKLIVPGYLIPLRHAHATIGSMLSRIATATNEGVSFIAEAQRKEADNALRVSHNILLDVLAVQHEHFAVPGSKEQNELCLQDFMDIWQQPSSSPTRSSNSATKLDTKKGGMTNDGYKKVIGLPESYTPDNKKALDLALEIRKFEIELYWKRATYFWAFIAVALGGYVSILAAKDLTHNERREALLTASCLGLVFSVAWYFVNRASKFWQENWEKHVDLLEDAVIGPLYKTVLSDDDLRFWRLWGPYRFSVSKLNQILSLFVVLLFLLLTATTLWEHFHVGWPFDLFATVIVIVTISALWTLWRHGRTAPMEKVSRIRSTRRRTEIV